MGLALVRTVISLLLATLEKPWLIWLFSSLRLPWMIMAETIKAMATMQAAMMFFMFTPMVKVKGSTIRVPYTPFKVVTVLLKQGRRRAWFLFKSYYGHDRPIARCGCGCSQYVSALVRISCRVRIADRSSFAEFVNMHVK